MAYSLNLMSGKSGDTLEGICLRLAAASTFSSCSGLLNPHTLQVGLLPAFVTPHSGHFQSDITLSSAGVLAVFSASSMGYPQCTQNFALSLIVFPHSGQIINAIYITSLS